MTPMRTPMEPPADSTGVTEDEPHAWLDGRLSDEQRRAPAVRHPVEVAAAQQEHLGQWLSKHLGRPLKAPDFSTQGYELVGERL
jgi:anti-sigma factor RsiW